MFIQNMQAQQNLKEAIGMKAIKVNKAKTDGHWYAKHIGEHVPYLGDVGGEWKSREISGYVNFVQYEDGEVVTLSLTDIAPFLKAWYNVSLEIISKPTGEK